MYLLSFSKSDYNNLMCCLLKFECDVYFCMFGDVSIQRKKSSLAFGNLCMKYSVISKLLKFHT